MPYEHKSGYQYVDFRRASYPRIQVSTNTKNKKRAEAMERTLQRFVDEGRRDILEQIRDGRRSLSELHDAFESGKMARVNELLRSGPALNLGELVDEWLQWLRRPSSLSRRDRPFSPTTIARYSDSWTIIFRALSRGRDSDLTDLSPDFLKDFRRQRKSERSAATVNRDLTTLQSFFGWLREERAIDPPALAFKKEREDNWRDRWLDSSELAAIKEASHPDWWVLFATLLHTGARLGEAQRLRWADIRFAAGQIQLGRQGAKSSAGRRAVPLTSTLRELLLTHASVVDSAPGSAVFPGKLGKKSSAESAWLGVLKRSGIAHATLHDLRHTFGVQHAQGGTLLPQLQSLMGHSTPAMTLRYLQHTPEPYFAKLAEVLEQRLSGQSIDFPALKLVSEGRKSA